jgi:hypothetical protein
LRGPAGRLAPPASHRRACIAFRARVCCAAAITCIAERQRQHAHRPRIIRRGDADAAQCRDADVDALAEALNAHGATRPAGQHLSLLRLLTALRSCTSPFPTVRLTCPKSFFVSPVALSAVLQLGLRICVHGDGVTRSGRASRPVLPRQIAQLGRSFEHEHMASRPRPNHWHALRSPCRRCRLRPTICCVCVV